jgi:predicted AAA+ superfamily ATPase
MKSYEVFFWATYQGLEIDLFFLHRGRRFGVEFKFNEAPKATRSMHAPLETLMLNHLWVIYPGEHKYPVHKK